MHFPKMAAILNFGGHFGSYIDYYKSETFLMPNTTFVDIFIGVLQEPGRQPTEFGAGFVFVTRCLDLDWHGAKHENITKIKL